MVTLPDLPQTEIAIVEMTNAFRKEQQARRAQAERGAGGGRARLRRLPRQSPASSRTRRTAASPPQRAEAQGYRYCTVAENLALNLDSRGFETRQLARNAVEGWKASPGHRANMLRPHVTEIGVAVVRAPDRDPKFISVQLFGRPDSLKVDVHASRTAREPRCATSWARRRHSLPPRTIATYTRCEPDKLIFEKAGTGRTAP